MANDIGDHERALLLSFLADRDVHCPLCQYNLRNCTVPECPECGKPIRLAVVALDLSVAAWGFMTFMLALPAGIGVVFIAMIIREGLPPPRRDEFVTVILFVASVPLAITSLLFRRRFLKMKKKSQYLLAAIGAAVTIALFITFVVNMMH